jgi:hypothetical protein
MYDPDPQEARQDTLTCLNEILKTLGFDPISILQAGCLGDEFNCAVTRTLDEAVRDAGIAFVQTTKYKLYFAFAEKTVTPALSLKFGHLNAGIFPTIDLDTHEVLWIFELNNPDCLHIFLSYYDAGDYPDLIIPQGDQSHD